MKNNKKTLLDTPSETITREVNIKKTYEKYNFVRTTPSACLCRLDNTMLNTIKTLSMN